MSSSPLVYNLHPIRRVGGKYEFRELRELFVAFNLAVLSSENVQELMGGDQYLRGISECISTINTVHSNNNGDSNYRKRRQATTREREVLENYYQTKSTYPTPINYEILARKLGFTVKRVRLWFQNRRAKEKRKRPSI